MDWNERVAARSGLHIELVYRRPPTPQKASENCGWMAKEPRGTTSGRHAVKSVCTCVEINQCVGCITRFKHAWASGL